MKDQFLGIDLDPQFPGNSARIFSFDAMHHIVKDLVSGTLFSQTYAGTNRTRINSAGLLEAVPANTPVIDHVGASLTPALRVEPQAANLLFGSNTFTAAAGWMLSTMSEPTQNADGTWNFVDASAATTAYIYRKISKSASDSTTYYGVSIRIKKTTGATTFPAFGVTFLTTGTQKFAYYVVNTNAGTAAQVTSFSTAGNITYQIKSDGDSWALAVMAQDNGANTELAWYYASAVNSSGTAMEVATQGTSIASHGMIFTGSIPSSYFAGADAIGSELVTDGGFAAVTEGAAINSGTFTVGNCYKIASHTDADFTTVGAPDSNVGTYFNATATGAGVLDAGDTVNPITFTSWTAGTGWAPQATAGVLTGKAQKIAGTASDLEQDVSAVASTVYRVSSVITSTAGTLEQEVGGVEGENDYAANATAYDYIIASGTGNLKLKADASFAGTVDTASVKTHGTVRASEANTVTLAVPAAVSSALADTGTIVMSVMLGYARAAGVVGNLLASTTATDSLIYTTTAAGNISSNDGTAVAESAAAYTSNTWTKIALKWPSSTDKYRIGVDIDGAGIVWGDEQAFDGSFTVGANLILGYALHGPMWIKNIKFYDKILTDAQINATN